MNWLGGLGSLITGESSNDSPSTSPSTNSSKDSKDKREDSDDEFLDPEDEITSGNSNNERKDQGSKRDPKEDAKANLSDLEANAKKAREEAAALNASAIEAFERLEREKQQPGAPPPWSRVKRVKFDEYPPPEADSTDLSAVIDVYFNVTSNQFFELFLSDHAIFSFGDFHHLRGDKELVVSNWGDYKRARDAPEDPRFNIKGTRERRMKGQLQVDTGTTRLHKVQRLVPQPDGMLMVTRAITPDVPFGTSFSVTDIWHLKDVPGERRCHLMIELGGYFEGWTVTPFIMLITSRIKNEGKLMWESWTDLAKLRISRLAHELTDSKKDNNDGDKDKDKEKDKDQSGDKGKDKGKDGGNGGQGNGDPSSDSNGSKSVSGPAAGGGNTDNTNPSDSITSAKSSSSSTPTAPVVSRTPSPPVTTSTTATVTSTQPIHIPSSSTPSSSTLSASSSSSTSSSSRDASPSPSPSHPSSLSSSRGPVPPPVQSLLSVSPDDIDAARRAVEAAARMLAMADSSSHDHDEHNVSAAQTQLSTPSTTSTTTITTTTTTTITGHSDDSLTLAPPTSSTPSHGPTTPSSHPVTISISTHPKDSNPIPGNTTNPVSDPNDAHHLSTNHSPRLLPQTTSTPSPRLDSAKSTPSVKTMTFTPIEEGGKEGLKEGRESDNHGNNVNVIDDDAQLTGSESDDLDDSEDSSEDDTDEEEVRRMTPEELVRHEKRVQRRTRDRRRRRRRQARREARRAGTVPGGPKIVRPGEAGTGSGATLDGRLRPSLAEIEAGEARLAAELEAQQRRMCTRECRPAESIPGCVTI